ncbi:hypothetical protein O9992_22785 [Vibrio lentus]|nr:hypothetical protein [Vibrio lentus]
MAPQELETLYSTTFVAMCTTNERAIPLLGPATRINSANSSEFATNNDETTQRSAVSICLIRRQTWRVPRYAGNDARNPPTHVLQIQLSVSLPEIAGGAIVD